MLVKHYIGSCARITKKALKHIKACNHEKKKKYRLYMCGSIPYSHQLSLPDATITCTTHFNNCLAKPKSAY